MMCGIVIAICMMFPLTSARAPGDADSFCTTVFPSSVNIPPIYPPNLKILLDSYNYVNLLPPQDGAVW